MRFEMRALSPTHFYYYGDLDTFSNSRLINADF